MKKLNVLRVMVKLTFNPRLFIPLTTKDEKEINKRKKA